MDDIVKRIESLPEHPKNADVVKAIFPDLEVRRGDTAYNRHNIYTDSKKYGCVGIYTLDWWKAPYGEQS